MFRALQLLLSCVYLYLQLTVAIEGDDARDVSVEADTKGPYVSWLGSVSLLLDNGAFWSGETCGSFAVEESAFCCYVSSRHREIRQLNITQFTIVKDVVQLYVSMNNMSFLVEVQKGLSQFVKDESCYLLDVADDFVGLSLSALLEEVEDTFHNLIVPCVYFFFKIPLGQLSQVCQFQYDINVIVLICIDNLVYFCDVGVGELSPYFNFIIDLLQVICNFHLTCV